MKALRTTLAALFVFALLHAGCRGKQAAQQNAAATPEGAAPQPPPPSFTLPDGDARTLFEHGINAYRQDRDEEAAAAFKRAVELDPELAEGYYRLGLAYSVTRQDEEADKAFEECVKAYEKRTKKEPKDSDSFYFLGLCPEKLRQYDDAVRRSRRRSKNRPPRTTTSTSSWPRRTTSSRSTTSP